MKHARLEANKGIMFQCVERVQHGDPTSLGLLGLPGETPRDGLRGAGSGHETKHCMLSYAWKLMYDVCMMMLWG